MDEIFDGKFKALELIGNGSFGEIYRCINIQTKQILAIKLEELDAAYPQLVNEYNVYKALQGEEHIPKIYAFGKTMTHRFLVMDSLGSSIDCAFDDCDHQFTPKTVLMLAAQMITCVETLHKHGYIHRDIKPDNFIMGKGEKNRTVLIIDMGLAKKYVTDEEEHVPFEEGLGFSGTVRYASINALLGFTTSRRDDLEALGYVWVFLMKGDLPWCKLENEKKTPDRYQRFAQCKKDHVLTDLCNGLPKELNMYFQTVLSLEFEEEPDYSFLRSLVIQALANYGEKIDYVYDWAETSETMSKQDQKSEEEKKSKKHKKRVRVQAQSSDPKQTVPAVKGTPKKKGIKRVRSSDGMILEMSPSKRSPLIANSDGSAKKKRKTGKIPKVKKQEK